jgi:hypothetical protein
MTEGNQIPKKNESLHERIIGDEVIVLSSEGNELHTFEGSARFIWGMLNGVRTVDDILALITEEYQVEAATAARDLDNFLEELRRLSLIKK